MRGEVSRDLLWVIEEGIDKTADIFDVFFNYHNRWSQTKRPSAHDKQVIPSTVEKENQRIKVMLYRLKQQGCLEVLDQKWKITIQ